MNKNNILMLLIVVLVFLTAVNIFTILSMEFMPKHMEKEKIELTSVPCEEIFENKVIAKAPAINTRGEGMLLDLEVAIMPGSGRLLTDIENLLFWVDTQKSIKTAKIVAEKVSGIDTSNMDISYTLRAAGNTSAVGGGSAGAILALSTIAVLKNKQLNYSIIVTGSIDENGTIGQVGGIESKIEVAKKSGATLFLIPKGQGITEVTKSMKECEDIGSTEICEISYKRIKSTPLGEKLNITIKEISNISEAMEYYKL
ncbi:MAG: hypothetical protein JSW73_02485 [Candidatus Woesearchaeota archaeon]|nr:MAG: hypothetical protein JSW73_02485 [Candidatus Woesearchaeota archaeon]